MSDFSPSRCEITKAIITSYGRENVVSEDINTIIGAFDIEHGIGKVALTGSVTVLDTTGLLERFPQEGKKLLILKSSHMIYKPFAKSRLTFIKLRI